MLVVVAPLMVGSQMAVTQERGLTLTAVPAIGVTLPLATYGTFDIGEGKLGTSSMINLFAVLSTSALPVELFGLAGTSIVSNMVVTEVGCEAECLWRASVGRLFLTTIGLQMRVPTPATEVVVMVRGGFGQKVWHRTKTEIIGCGPLDLICPSHQYFRKERSERTLQLGLGFRWRLGKHRLVFAADDFVSAYLHRDPSREPVRQHDLTISLGIRLKVF